MMPFWNFMSDGLDPTLSTSNCSGLLRQQLANPLVEEGSGGMLIPELAESWESSKDVKKWTFKLRKGIEFHNGKTFDVEDAIYSLASHRQEGTKSQAKAYLADVQEMKADGKHTLVVTLSQGNVDFPTILAFPSLLMVPAGTTDYTNFIGTGPYILKNFEPGVRSLTQKNPNYWKDNRGHFDEVEILGIADVNLKIVREPDDGYWTNVWMQKPFCASKWSGRLNEDMMFSTAYSSGAPWNETFWNNERFNRLLKGARTELDENKRREMYVEMQRLVRDEDGSVIPVFGDFVYAASSKIRFGELSSSWELDGLRAPERWWFES